jgi:CheY-like chemotaxis protein
MTKRTSPGAHRPRGETDRPPVFVVDESPAAADRYRSWLADSYDVTVATSVGEALRLWDDVFEVIYVDQQLSGLIQYRMSDDSENGLSAQTVLLMSSRLDCAPGSLGFDTHLTKPISKTTLLEKTEALLQRRRYMELMDRYFSLASERARYKAHVAPDQLASDDEYQSLVEEITSVKKELDAIIANLDEQELIEYFDQLPAQSSATHL